MNKNILSNSRGIGQEEQLMSWQIKTFCYFLLSCVSSIAICQISNDSHKVCHLHEDVSGYSKVGLLYSVKPLEESVSHTDAVLVQQELEDRTVSWEKFQSADAVQESFSRCRHILMAQYAQQRVWTRR